MLRLKNTLANETRFPDGSVSCFDDADGNMCVRSYGNVVKHDQVGEPTRGHRDIWITRLPQIIAHS